MAFKQKILRIIQRLVFLTHEREMIPISMPINTTRKLEGKVALITGGSSGIGLAMAEAFIRNGCKVIIAGTNNEKLMCAIDKMGGKNDHVQSMQLNVLDVKALPEKISMAALLFPENRIDILVNSAGVVAHSAWEDMTEEEYDKIMDTNAKGVFFMSRAVSEYMIKRGQKGHILNVSSSSALRPAWTAYEMSKWAVRGLTMGMADNLIKKGITVNAIAPGPVATPMLDKHEGDSIYNGTCPVGRYATAGEIAEMGVMLVSDMSDLVVGETVYMTGGSGTITLHR